MVQQQSTEGNIGLAKKFICTMLHKTLKDPLANPVLFLVVQW